MRQMRRGTILLEVMIAIVMLALVVPISVSWMQDSASDRADAIGSLRASAMATLIAEHIIADSVSSSPTLGMSALADPTNYLETPATGLRARLTAILAPYTDKRYTFDVTIGGLVGPGGVATGDMTLDVARPVAITVHFPGARQPTLSLAIHLLVTDPQ